MAPTASPSIVRFGSKAETLDSLKRTHPELNIPEMLFFPVSRWSDDPHAVLGQILGRFPEDALLAVRSSCRSEDTMESSGAGAYESILDVPAHDVTAISRAIAKVVDAYPGNAAERASRNDQVLVQAMLVDVAVSGVIMTRALEDGSPYFTINYDDESGRTDSITGGTGAGKTVYVFKGVKDPDFDSPRVRAMVSLARNLETIFESCALDIEFALDADDVPHLFQVRPITCSAQWGKNIQKDVSSSLIFIDQLIDRHMHPKPGLFGRRSILGVMPDWNPAELIGVAPRPLASSLFRELVTKRVWSQARETMGYRQIPPEELMVQIVGRPYIDTRASFNSLLPAGLEPTVSERLMEAYTGHLENNPQLHDKVEFDVLFTVLDFNLRHSFEERYPALLADDEFRHFEECLRRTTAKNLDLSPGGTLDRAERSIRALHERQQKRRIDFSAFTDGEALSHVRNLIEECCREGTLPFSILARHGFIAEALLRSAVQRRAITAERVAQFKRTVKTVSSRFALDFGAACRDEARRESFLKQYGHLRPGTFDILSTCYRNRPNLFDGQPPLPPETGEDFILTPAERNALDELLRESGLNAATDPNGIFGYARRAIIGREYGKFVFTRNVSEALEVLAAWGASLGLTREDLSYLSLNDVLSQTVAPVSGDIASHFKTLSARGAETFELGRSLKLSYLIRSRRDVYVVPQHRGAPNFITAARVEADCITIDSCTDCNTDLRGKVVCIESADPGYDWIFMKSIAGLVTKFGGTNSHMAIRCAEYGIPAAIGCGEKLFESVSSARSVELDAGGKYLRPIR